ncbi:MAG: L,D-transpeptidase family protein, partial [Clostridia bacterium]|nr:L,D-transpeptidase family protein [Clostridia bacterium]
MLGLLMAVAILLGTLSPAFAATAKAESLKYWIGVDIANQRTTIYSTEDNSVVHRWICSTGKKGYTTPVGVYYLPAAKGNERKEWFSFTKSYVKYAVCYKKGLYFHSILYKTKSDNSVMQSSVRQLGSVASHGCIRLEVQHAKWLCDNCPTGTKVVIHNGTSDPRIVEALGGEAGVEMTEPLPAPPIVQAVSLEQTGTVTLNRGETLQLNCTVKPDGIEANLNWKSSSTKYATVNGSGLVTGVAEGTTTITVSSSNGKKATVKVKVVDPYKPT